MYFPYIFIIWLWFKANSFNNQLLYEMISTHWHCSVFYFDSNSAHISIHKAVAKIHVFSHTRWMSLFLNKSLQRLMFQHFNSSRKLQNQPFQPQHMKPVQIAFGEQAATCCIICNLEVSKKSLNYTSRSLPLVGFGTNRCCSVIVKPETDYHYLDANTQRHKNTIQSFYHPCGSV